MADLDASAWPLDRLGEALDALAGRAGLSLHRLDAPTPPPSDRAGIALGSWLGWAAERLGLELEEVESAPTRLPELLRAAGPALLAVGQGGGTRVLLLLRCIRGRLCLVGPDLRVRRVPLETVHRALTADLEVGLAPEVDTLLRTAGILGPRRARAARALLDEQLAGSRVRGCWLLHTPPGAGFAHQLLAARVPQGLLAMLAVFALLYGLEVLGWGLIGRGALDGRLDPGWLIAWVLLLLGNVPLGLVGQRLQARVALETGALLKRRLLAGALNMEIDAIRRQGAGHLLGQVIESQALESLALNGGFAVLVALVELALAAWVLGQGAGGGPQVLLLCAWLLLAVALGWRYAQALGRWTRARLDLTHDLVESLVGHRTRLAQGSPDSRHQAEDQALERFLALSAGLDRRLVPLFGGLPRGWLVVGLAGLVPAFVLGDASTAGLAIGLGGVLLAWRAFGGAVSGLAALARAGIAWEAVAPLFRAAGALEAAAGSPPQIPGPGQSVQRPGGAPVLVQARNLSFRYRPQGEPVLHGCDISIRHGERVLVEGPSGGGKSTLAALLAGLRRPEAGLLLLAGLDRATLGAGWRRLVAAAPQFHENHVLTASLAFNLLLGRCWPPAETDLDEAEDLCRELGLGPLLERMPSGLMQMVGETGWQLSHGERSRLYLARALLQGAPLVVLDESFAALDPETLGECLACALRRADTLLVIAHP
jgi:ATP-binding cassette subfamily B protein